MKRQNSQPPTHSRSAMRRSESLFAADRSKAYFEAISLVWAPLSLVALLVGVFATGLHNYCDRYTYLLISVLLCVPGFVLPFVYPCEADRKQRFVERFWVKAALWIAIFSFYGNYFWTHYFYHMLGARYLFDAHRFNDVPVVCYLCTYFYFTFYFSLVNIVLRAVSRFANRRVARRLRPLVWCTCVCALAYGTAVFEAVSIQHFPLYTYSDKKRFVTVGSIVYGLYFVVGFPMFFAIDENPQQKSSLYDVAINSLAATAIVTLLLDLWRMYIGNIYQLGRQSPPVPFIYQRKQAALSVSQRLADQLTLFKLRSRFLTRSIIHRVQSLANALAYRYFTTRDNLVRIPIPIPLIRSLTPTSQHQALFARRFDADGAAAPVWPF